MPQHMTPKRKKATPYRPRRIGTRFPNICDYAKKLGVHRSSLFRALTGDRPAPKLLARYEALKRQEASEA